MVSWGPNVVVSDVKSFVLPIWRLPMWAVETDALQAARASARIGPVSRNNVDDREGTGSISCSPACGNDSRDRDFGRRYDRPILLTPTGRKRESARPADPRPRPMPARSRRGAGEADRLPAAPRPSRGRRRPGDARTVRGVP